MTVRDIHYLIESIYYTHGSWIDDKLQHNAGGKIITRGPTYTIRKKKFEKMTAKSSSNFCQHFPRQSNSKEYLETLFPF